MRRLMRIRGIFAACHNDTRIPNYLAGLACEPRPTAHPVEPFHPPCRPRRWRFFQSAGKSAIPSGLNIILAHQPDRLDRHPLHNLAKRQHADARKRQPNHLPNPHPKPRLTQHHRRFSSRPKCLRLLTNRPRQKYPLARRNPPKALRCTNLKLPNQHRSTTGSSVMQCSRSFSSTYRWQIVRATSPAPTPP